MMTEFALKSKFLGGMVGSSLGDAIGEMAFFRRPASHGSPQDELLRRVNDKEELVYTDDTAMAIGIAESLIEVGRLDVQHLGDTFARNFNSVPFAIYSFLRYWQTYQGCLLCAVLNRGDRDTLGAMACAISGAYLGIEKIPAEWRKKLENEAYIAQLAVKLAEMKKTAISF